MAKVRKAAVNFWACAHVIASSVLTRDTHVAEVHNDNAYAAVD